MAKGKKKNVKSKKRNAASNAQNNKVTLEKRQAKKDVVLGAEKKGRLPVSYTHLTLPTRSCQCRCRWWPYH
mgnify:CR=1 FL=1